jgi:phosphoribosylformylglycinamidine synthase
MSKELVASAHDCSDAGLAAAVAECCFGFDSGASIDLSQIFSSDVNLDIWGALFGESLGRILVSINPKNSQEFEESMKGHEYNLLGTVRSDDEIIFKNTNQIVLSASMSGLRNSWKGTLKGGSN